MALTRGRLGLRRTVRWPRRHLVAATAVVLVSVLVGCGAPSAPAPAPADTALAGRLRPVIEQTMRALTIPGAVVLVRTPNAQFLQAFGTRAIGADDPVRVTDHFRVGSNTKTMTGTVLLQLVQEGKIALTDPVAKYRPEVPNGQNITVAQLLDMRSGLDSYTFLRSFNQTLDDDPGKVWQPDELAALGVAMPPRFPPGQGYLYSNTNFVLAGLIVEQVTGRKIEQVFQERLFTPLRLANTVMPPITSAAIPDPHPRGYLYGTNVSTLQSAVLPEDQQRAAAEGTLRPHDVTDLNPSWGWAAGAAISNAEDLATYVKALVVGGLLEPGMQRQRLDSLVPINPADSQAGSYGLAIAKLGPFLGHDGSLPGYQSFMGYDPEKQQTLIVLTNLQDSPDGQATANALAKAVIPLL